MRLKIEQIDINKGSQWDDFVQSHPIGNIYQLSDWARIVASSFGFIPKYFVLKNQESDRIVGVVPAMIVKSLFAGNRLSALPLSAHCDFLIPPESEPEVMRFLFEKFKNVKYFEFKNLHAATNLPEGLALKTSFVTHLLSLESPLDELFRALNNSNIRRKIKKAQQNKLQFRFSDAKADLEKFYSLLVQVRKKHGLPPQPYVFFKNMWDYLKPKNNFELALVELKGKVVSGAILLNYKNRFYYEYGAAKQKFQHLGGNQLLLWEMIKSAREKGGTMFDFGRSSRSNASLVTYKNRWAAKETPLYYYYFPGVKSDGSDEENLLMNILKKVNRVLPGWMLRLEGNLVYRHFV